MQPALAWLKKAGADLNASWRNYRALHALLQEEPHAAAGKPAPARLACLEWLFANGADPEQLGAWPSARAIIVASTTAATGELAHHRAGNRPRSKSWYLPRVASTFFYTDGCHSNQKSRRGRLPLPALSPNRKNGPPPITSGSAVPGHCQVPAREAPAPQTSPRRFAAPNTGAPPRRHGSSRMTRRSRVPKNSRLPVFNRLREMPPASANPSP